MSSPVGDAEFVQQRDESSHLAIGDANTAIVERSEVALFLPAQLDFTVPDSLVLPDVDDGAELTPRKILREVGSKIWDVNLVGVNEEEKRTIRVLPQPVFSGREGSADGDAGGICLITDADGAVRVLIDREPAVDAEVVGNVPALRERGGLDAAAAQVFDERASQASVELQFRGVAAGQ